MPSIMKVLPLAFVMVAGPQTAEPPKWMGALQTATPRLSFKLGLLLLGVIPTDILTSTAVGRHHDAGAGRSVTPDL